MSAGLCVFTPTASLEVLRSRSDRMSNVPLSADAPAACAIMSPRPAAHLMQSRIALLATLLIVLASRAAAQETAATPRFEVGGQISLLRLGEFVAGPDGSQAAGGARFTWNVTNAFALESQFDFYPSRAP